MSQTSEQAAWKEQYLGNDDYREALNDTEIIEQHDNAGLRECTQAQGPYLCAWLLHLLWDSGQKVLMWLEAN